jgi:hypothetical protein
MYISMFTYIYIYIYIYESYVYEGSNEMQAKATLDVQRIMEEA